MATPTLQGTKKTITLVDYNDVNDFVTEAFPELSHLDEYNCACVEEYSNDTRYEKSVSPMPGFDKYTTKYRIYDNLSEVVFYIGATGSLPDSIKAEMLTADEIQALMPLRQRGLPTTQRLRRLSTWLGSVSTDTATERSFTLSKSLRISSSTTKLASDREKRPS